jgi:hypothetical protein
MFVLSLDGDHVAGGDGDVVHENLHNCLYRTRVQRYRYTENGTERTVRSLSLDGHHVAGGDGDVVHENPGVRGYVLDDELEGLQRRRNYVRENRARNQVPRVRDRRRQGPHLRAEHRVFLALVWHFVCDHKEAKCCRISERFWG